MMSNHADGAHQTDTLGGDLMIGAEEMAEFLFGDRSKKSCRKVYRLAETKALPIFKMGGLLAGRRSTFVSTVAQREAGQVAPDAPDAP